jgi:superfamily I DNA/RNA helicase
MEVYINQTFRRSILEEPEKVQIYNTYLRYEQWKLQIKGFDFMDIVNHILRELKGAQYRGTPIHFMLVDEVQDLTAATIKLLLNITEQNVYFAGDTA